MSGKAKPSKEELLAELYLELLVRGPGFGSAIEFWDPTPEAIIIFEQLGGLNVIQAKRGKRVSKNCRLSTPKSRKLH